MKTEELFDKLCDITPIIDAISEKARGDAEITKALARMKTAKTRLAIITSVLPIMKKCKDEVFEIFSILTNKSVEELKEQDSMVTINSIVKIFSDFGLADFSQSALQNADEAAGADELSTSSESTEGAVADPQPDMLSEPYVNTSNIG